MYMHIKLLNIFENEFLPFIHTPMTRTFTTCAILRLRLTVWILGHESWTNGYTSTYNIQLTTSIFSLLRRSALTFRILGYVLVWSPPSADWVFTPSGSDLTHPKSVQRIRATTSLLHCVFPLIGATSTYYMG